MEFTASQKCLAFPKSNSNSTSADHFGSRQQLAVAPRINAFGDLMKFHATPTFRAMTAGCLRSLGYASSKALKPDTSNKTTAERDLNGDAKI